MATRPKATQAQTLREYGYGEGMRNVTIVLALFWVGCGPSATSLCEDTCDCTGCSDSELTNCIDALEDAEKAAEDEGCSDQYSALQSCVADEFECIDGAVDADGCAQETENLIKCAL